MVQEVEQHGLSLCISLSFKAPLLVGWNDAALKAPSWTVKSSSGSEISEKSLICRTQLDLVPVTKCPLCAWAKCPPLWLHNSLYTHYPHLIMALTRAVWNYLFMWVKWGGEFLVRKQLHEKTTALLLCGQRKTGLWSHWVPSLPGRAPEEASFQQPLLVEK